MGIKKVSDSDFEGIILDPGNYEDEINQIEIPHERARKRNGALTEDEQTILRSGQRKSMWVARISRPGAIYDESAAAQTFSEGKMVDSMGGNGDIPGNEERGFSARKNDFEHMPSFRKFYKRISRMPIRRAFWGKRESRPIADKFHGREFVISEKGDPEINGGYQIKSPSVDWAVSEIAIEIHFADGKILTKTGRRAQIGICGFRCTKLQREMLSFDIVFLYPGWVTKAQWCPHLVIREKPNHCFMVST